MVSKVLKSIVSVGIFACINISALASVVIVHDPISFSKTVLVAKNSADSLINQAHQIKNQFDMIKNQALDLKRLPNFTLSEISNLLNKLDSITRESEAISYSMSNWDSQFRKLYPDYSKSKRGEKDFQLLYQQWQSGTLNTLRNSIGAANQLAVNSRIEQQKLSEIKRQAQNAQGNMQILQTSTELAAENIQQLQTLKRIMLAQMNSQNAYMAREVSQKTYEQQTLTEIIDAIPSDFPEYRENSHFGKIRNFE